MLKQPILLCLTAVFCSALGCAVHPVPILHEEALEETLYTRYTLRGERSGFSTRLFRSNYLGHPVVFPAGSQVRFKMFSQVRVDLDVNGIPCQMSSPYSPFPASKEGIDTFLEKHFSAKPVKLNKLDSSIQLGVEQGQAAIGMKKEHVLMAVGYPTKIDDNIDADPLNHEQIIKSNQWIYRHSIFAWIVVWKIYRFDMDGKLSQIIQ